MDASEPCLRCGDETAVGSPLFSGRRHVEHKGGSAFLCQACDEQLAGSRRGKRLTDDEVRKLVDAGSAVAVTWTK
jgi:hypothetical protein